MRYVSFSNISLHAHGSKEDAWYVCWLLLWNKELTTEQQGRQTTVLAPPAHQKSGNRARSPVTWFLILEKTGVIGNCKRWMKRFKTGGFRRHGFVRSLDSGRLMGIPYYLL